MGERYTLTKTTLKRLLSMGVLMDCRYCEKPLEVGQEVLRMSYKQTTRSHRFHADCWDNKARV